MQSSRSVCHSLVLSVCHCVCMQHAALPQKLSADFIETWCYDSAYQSEEMVNFWWWSGLGYGFRVTFPLRSSIAEWGTLGDLGPITIRPTHTVVGWFSRHSAKWLTLTSNEYTTFWERSSRHPDPNPEIWIRNFDNFRLRRNASAEVCVLCYSYEVHCLYSNTKQKKKNK